MEKKPKVEFNKKKEDLIRDLVQDERWQAVKDAINRRIEHLKNFLDPFSGKLIIENDTPEMVGFKFLIISAIIDYLAEIRDLPENLAKINEREQ